MSTESEVLVVFPYPPPTRSVKFPKEYFFCLSFDAGDLACHYFPSSDLQKPSLEGFFPKSEFPQVSTSLLGPI